MQLMSFCSTPGAIGLIVNTASLVIENRKIEKCSFSILGFVFNLKRRSIDTFHKQCN